MTTTQSSFSSRYSFLSIALISFGLCATACGGAEDSDTDEGSVEQGTPNAQQESGEVADEAQLPPAEGLPVDPNASGAAGGTALNLFELLEQDQCNTGWIDDEGETPGCNAKFREVCFETNEEACECAGCGSDACLVAESFPTQISCQVQELPEL